jgi:hypothetical protein
VKKFYKKQKKIILPIIGVIALFFLYQFSYNAGFFSKEKFYTCEVGMELKPNKGDGGPEVMVLKFNLKTKLPNAYIYTPKSGTGFTHKVRGYKIKKSHKNKYELKFIRSGDYGSPLWLRYEGYSYHRKDEIVNFTINRTNLKINHIITEQFRAGGLPTYVRINKTRRIRYGICEETTEPVNKI